MITVINLITPVFREIRGDFWQEKLAQIRSESGRFPAIVEYRLKSRRNIVKFRADFNLYGL